MPPPTTSQLFSIAGLVVVITGGGSGVGHMMAHALAENGAAQVYILGRREEHLTAVAEAYPHIISPIVCDVTSRESLQSAAEEVKCRVKDGYIDLLIANAGMGGPGLRGVSARPTVGEFVQAAWQTNPQEFTDVFALNCTAVFYTTLAFLELLDAGNRRQGPHPIRQSQVIITASMAGYLRDARYGFAYTSSKSAVISLTKTLATYCVPWGIRFNAIAPGLFSSDMSAPLLAPFRISPAKNVCEPGAMASSYIPAERAGAEEDLIGVVIYLASQAGSYVNGSVLLVDGGKVATMPATY